MGKKIRIFFIVIISLGFAFAGYERIDLTQFIRPTSAVVTGANLQSAPSNADIGKSAGDEIPRIVSREMWETLTEQEYVTAEPVTIIKTGIYALKPWVKPYSNQKGRYGRKKAEAANCALLAMADYQQIYLIELQDGTMLPAQFSRFAETQIEKGNTAALPIGVKKSMNPAVKTYLTKAGDTYGADVSGILYMLDDAWEKEHDFQFFLIRFGISFLIFWVMSVTLVLVSDKLFCKKEAY